MITGPPVLDPAAVHPDLTRLREAVNAADWPAVEQFFAELPDGNASTFAADFVSQLPGVEGFLESVTPCPLASVLLASRYVIMAWEARSGLRAHQVSSDQFAAMHTLLRRAEPLLIDVTALEPDNAAAWTARVTIARGLELGQSEARRRYDRLARHQPNIYLAQTSLVQQLCPKWSGSWEAVFAFARDCVRTAPGGSLSPAVIGEAHLERYFNVGGAQDTDYLRGAEVLAEVQEAAEHSVWHADFTRGYGWVRAHGYYAAIFSLAGEWRSAAAHFRELGDFASERPWQYLGDPARTFSDYRARALREGARS